MFVGVDLRFHVNLEAIMTWAPNILMKSTRPLESELEHLSLFLLESCITDCKMMEENSLLVKLIDEAEWNGAK